MAETMRESEIDAGTAQPNDAAPRNGAVLEAVTVEIYDQVYHLRGMNPGYLHRLAGVVDEKMRAVAAHGSTVDSLRVAVLAALNITDELEQLRARNEALDGRSHRAEDSIRSLTGMLDEVLEDRRAG